MLIKLTIILTFLGFTFCYPKRIPVGVIVRKGDEILETVIRYVVWSQQRSLPDGQPPFIIELLKVVAENEDTVSYNQAVCSLLNQGIIALLSPAAPPFFSLIEAYSREFQMPLISPDLPEEAAHFDMQYAVGIPPPTTRAILSLIQHYGWKEIVYLYDHDYGPEKLQYIFTLGYRALNLHLGGISKVTSAEEANGYLRKLDSSKKAKKFYIILDTKLSLSRNILLRHVHDIHVRKKNFHFLLTQLTLEDFWKSQTTEYGALNITGFLAVSPENNRYKSFKEEWMQLSPKVWPGAGSEINISTCYFHDAALILLRTIENIAKVNPRFRASNPGSSVWVEKKECFQDTPVPISGGARFANMIKNVNITDGVTGKIQFTPRGIRKDFKINVLETTPSGYHIFGHWSNGILRTTSTTRGNVSSLPLSQDKRLQITTIINPPFMMLKAGENGSELKGNDKFEGYCKDIIDLLAEELDFQYDLKLAEDGEYGGYEKTQGRWTGMIGEIIQGKADLAVADLIITGQRQRVADFSDPYETVGFGLVMKNPHAVLATSSIFFFLSAFSVNVWICIIVSVVLFSIFFYLITKFTGAPDSVESASGIWGRKPTVVVNIWFAISSSMTQGTGIYPRSISSRILSGTWWFVTLILSCLFIASMTAQMRVNAPATESSLQISQLKVLSMESIIEESLERGWPRIGIIYPSSTALFIKKSSLPTYVKYSSFMKENPDIKFSSVEEGLKKVRKSSGDLMLFLKSSTSEYVVRQKPCDLITTHDSVSYAGYGIATALRSPLRSKVNEALTSIQRRGMLGHLHRKWWIDSSQCKNGLEQVTTKGQLHSFSGLLCITVAGLLILLVLFTIQYTRKTQVKESRRQQLSFEDMNLDHNLPAPPPELLSEPPPVLNLPEYDKRTLL